MTVGSRTFLLDVRVDALEEGGYVASCPTLQGCHAEGETIAEAMTNLEDVARVLIELRIEDELPLPEELVNGPPSKLRAAVVVSVDRA